MISIRKILFFLIFSFSCTSYVRSGVELTFLIVLTGFTICVSKHGVKKDLLRYIKFPFLLIFIGLINAPNNSNSDVIKDLYYFLNPIVIFSFGYYIAYFIKLKDFITFVLKISIFLSFVYLVNYLQNFGSFRSVKELKEIVGMPSYIIPVALFILGYKLKIKQKVLRKYDTPVFFLLLSVLLLSLSRTFFLALFILLIFSSGFIKFNETFLVRVAFVSICLFSVFYFTSQSANDDRNTFQGKIFTSFNEVKISDYKSKDDINENWRGYESFMGLKQYSKGNDLEKIIGQGLGKNTPLGLEITLGFNTFAVIPKFHNGFITLLVKTGLLGVISYLLFFINLIRKSSKRQSTYTSDYLFVNRLIIGFTIVILSTTYIISGWLNNGTLSFLILSLGYFINYKNYILRENIN